MKKSLLFAICLLLMVSCERGMVLDYGENAPLVVEGWISEGESPIVMVTHALDLDSNRIDYSGFIEKWARVSIFDGDRQYLLSAHVDKRFIPSMIFTNNRLKGESGHIYRLLVETERGDAEATAKLEASNASLEIYSEVADVSDSTFVIRAFVTGLEKEGCYKFYVKSVGEDPHFYPAFKATFFGKDFPSDGFLITKGQRIQLDSEAKDRFSHFFYPGEVVQVKLCRIPNALYDFWRVYDNTMALGSNMLLNFTENCTGNLAGAYGYWQSEATSVKVIKIPLLKE